MTNTTSGGIAELPSGAQESIDLVVARAYQDLRAIAHRRLAGAKHGTLSTTALVHEAYLKLAQRAAAGWRDDEHFLALASLAMRYVLVDLARARATRKRGGVGRHVTLDEEVIGADEQAAMILDLHEALEHLALWEPRLARVVDCRYFGGLTEIETAEALGLTVRTVQRDWVKARVLLRHALDA
jgi:RNA polymerase sigma factor (TIGR02999 family)